MTTEQLVKLVVESLDNNKGRDVKVIDVHNKTTVADYMIIASATSERHAKALADHVIEDAKKNNHPPMGIEGSGGSSEWVLVDLRDLILHVMLPQTRAYYQLEKLWDPDFDEIKAAKTH